MDLRELCVLWRPRLAVIPQASTFPVGWGPSEAQLAETTAAMRTAAWLEEHADEESESDLEEMDLQLEETLDALATNNAYRYTEHSDDEEDGLDLSITSLSSGHKRPRFV